jgi:hypothetical protein
MKKYTYFLNNDSKQETIGIVKAINLKKAIQLAAQKKHLNEESFLSIYSVKVEDGA